jgi:peptide/nickel transport system substrate-binding protein
MRKEEIMNGKTASPHKSKTAMLLTGIAILSMIASSACASPGTGGADENTLRVGVISVSDQPLDPSKNTAGRLELALPIYDFLIEMDAEGKYGPGLATDWALSDDSMSFTITLREGVKFHDGSDFSSEDVKFTLELFASKDSYQSDQNILERYIKSIDTPDDSTVVLNFTEPCSQFEYILCSNATGAGTVLPSDYYQEQGAEGFAKAPIGTGAFRFVRYEAGVEALYERNENYWKELPKIKMLSIRQYAEESTRVAELQVGNIDFAPISGTNISAFDGNDDVRIAQVPYMTDLGLFISGAHDDTGAATQDARVREALSLAIHRDEIVDAIFEGNAVAAGGIWGFFPFTEGFDETRDAAVEYHPERAKALLKEAGYPDRFARPVVKLHLIPGGVYSEDVAQAIAASWADIGIQAEIVSIDEVELYALAEEDPLDEDFSGSLYFADESRKYSAFDALEPAYPSNSYFRLIQGNDEFDENVAKIASLSGEDKDEVLTSAIEAAAKEFVTIQLVYPGGNYAVSSRVASWDPGVSGKIGNWYCTFALNE